MGEYKFELEELEVWSQYLAEYFLEVLNGEKELDEAREDLASFRKGKWYTGSNPEYRLPFNDETQDGLAKLTIRPDATEPVKPVEVRAKTKLRASQPPLNQT